MRWLRLRILAGDGLGGTVEHVLTSDGHGLLAGRRELTEVMEDDEIKLGDIPLEVSQSGLFLGATKREELPPPSVEGEQLGGYRAVLSRQTEEGEETILDGVIPLVEIAHDVSMGTWAFPLLSNQEDLWERLDAIRLDDLSQAAYDSLAYVELPYYYRESFTNAGVTSSRWFHSVFGDHAGLTRYRWYDLLALCETVFEQAEGCELVGDLPVPTFSVDYEVDDEVRTIAREHRPHLFSFGSYRSGSYTRGNLTLPAWTGKELLERVFGMFGWRLRARYAPFPSTDILVEVLPDDWANPDPETLPALDERTAKGGYTRRAEPGAEGGFAVRHTNTLRQISLDLRMPLRYPTLVQMGHGTIPVPPPTVAILAQDRWLFTTPRPGARRAEEPEPSAETVYDSGFRLPYVGHPEAGGLQLGALDIIPDPAEHPDYEERVLYGLPVVDGDWEAAFLGVIVHLDPDEDGVSTPYMLWAREPADPAPTQHGLVNEVWARELYTLRSLSTQRLELADGDFYVQDLEMEVGVPSAGAALENRAWMLRERHIDLADDRAGLVLVRPDGRAAQPESPVRVGAVQDLAARYEISFEGQNVQQRLVILTWSPPPVGQGNFLLYDVQWRKVGAPLWTAAEAYATTHLFEVEHDETYEYMVRAVGDTTAWEGERLGVAMRGQITTNDDAVANS